MQCLTVAAIVCAEICFKNVQKENSEELWTRPWLSFFFLTVKINHRHFSFFPCLPLPDDAESTLIGCP